MLRPTSPLTIAVLLAMACDGGATAEAAKKVDDAAKTTQEQVDRAKQKIDDAKKTVDDTIDRAENVADATSAKAKSIADATTVLANKAWAGVRTTGELSKSTSDWVAEKAKTDDGKVERVIEKGVQVAPVALEIAKVVNAAVDDDVAVEPIYQSIASDGDEAKVDAAIEAMPRVEVIDGVHVGFSQLSRLDTGAKVEEQAYLVTWRRDDKLIGLVYRSKRTIDLDMLVEETPRLMAMTKQALADK